MASSDITSQGPDADTLQRLLEHPVYRTGLRGDRFSAVAALTAVAAAQLEVDRLAAQAQAAQQLVAERKRTFLELQAANRALLAVLCGLFEPALRVANVVALAAGGELALAEQLRSLVAHAPTRELEDAAALSRDAVRRLAATL